VTELKTKQASKPSEPLS